MWDIIDKFNHRTTITLVICNRLCERTGQPVNYTGYCWSGKKSVLFDLTGVFFVFVREYLLNRDPEISCDSEGEIQ